MAEERKMTLLERKGGPEDAISNVLSEGIKGLVRHNDQLQHAAEEKDKVLMQFVHQAQRERTEFWAIQANLVARFTEMIDTLQKLKDREADREEVRKDKQASREMKQQTLADVRQLVAIGANQYMKRPMLKESEKGLLAAFLESLDEDQIATLQEKLRPGQMAAFAKMVDAAKAQEDSDKPEDTHASD